MFIEVEQMSPRLFTYICLKDLIYELKNKEALLVYPISGILFPRALMGFKGLNKRIILFLFDAKMKEFWQLFKNSLFSMIWIILDYFR